MASDVALDDWLNEHAASERDVVVAIHKKASGKQTVTVVALQEAALWRRLLDEGRIAPAGIATLPGDF